MTFREKSLCLQFLAPAGVWGFYFWALIGMWGGGRPRDLLADATTLFVICVFLSLAVSAATGLVSLLISRRAERAVRDEREAAARARAIQVGYVLLCGAVVWGAWKIYALAAFLAYAYGLPETGQAGSPGPWIPNLVLEQANWILFGFVAAELLRMATEFILLKRGR